MITSYDLEPLLLMQTFPFYLFFLMSPNPAIPFGSHIAWLMYTQFMLNYYSNSFSQVLLPGQSLPVHVIPDF